MGPISTHTTGRPATRFSARRGLAAPSQPSTALVDRMVAHFVATGTGPDGSERLVSSADAVLATLQRAADAGRWDGVLALARVAAPAFMLGARWGAWETVLGTTLQASRALGDDEAEQWARRQLAVRAAALADQGT